MRFLAIVLAALTLACGGSPPAEDASSSGTAAAVPPVQDPVVVMFIVDGIDLRTVQTGVKNGAKTYASLIEQGVITERFYCTSPAPRATLPNGEIPWQGSTSANVALHTGTHIFDSRKMDDIFLNARRAGIVSMFAGGSRNYAVFDTVDHLYYGGDELTDEIVVERGLQHLNEDGARLLRLHPQHIRNAWTGPEGPDDPNSKYVQYFVNTVDPLLAKLIDGLKAAGVWEKTYIILSSDHGMGQTTSSNHPQSVRSSWETFAAFYGPGIKKGATIPYAEGPDIALMVNHFLGLPPLQGHLESDLPPNLRGTTGTFLENIFEGGPDDINHPRPIERFLDAGMPGDDYVEYRAGMIKLLSQ